MESLPGCLTRRLYENAFWFSEQPVFIYDPNNLANRPNDPDYGTVRKRWNFCPPLLQQLFIKAFTDGLHEPGRRVTEGEWQSGFLQLKEGALTCPQCGADNLWDPTVTALACWHCHKPVPIPGRLMVYLPTGRFYLLLTPGMKLRAYHLDPSQGAEGARAAVLGELVQNPNNPGQWGIRNLTAVPWSIEFTDGTRILSTNRSIDRMSTLQLPDEVAKRPLHFFWLVDWYMTLGE